MLLRSWVLLIVLVIVNSVSSKEDSTNIEVHKSRAVQPRYYFNHPPSAEYYNPIPVAIVYEDESDFFRRPIATTKAVKPGENGKLNITKDENVPTTTVSFKSSDTTTKIESKPKARALNNLQIPVAVIYESDSNSYQSHYRTKTDTITETSKIRRNGRRKQKSEANVDSQNKQSTQTLKAETEKSQIDIETSTIGKRTGGRDVVVPILDSENYVFSHNGNFHYRYEGGDGTKAYSEGKLKPIGDETGEAVEGGFSYTDKEGNDFSLSYTADENGYRPVGAHLPTPPPIPPAIARALKYLATATPEPVTKRPVKPESNIG